MHINFKSYKVLLSRNLNNSFSVKFRGKIYRKIRIYRHLEGKCVLYLLLVVVILGSTVQDAYCGERFNQRHEVSGTGVIIRGNLNQLIVQLCFLSVFGPE